MTHSALCSRRTLGHRLVLLAACGTCALAAQARAESVRFYDLEGFGHFLDGNPETTAVTEDGAVALPPPSRERFVDPAAVFSAATGAGDDVIVARVEDAQVLAVDRAGKTRPIFKAEETLVSALLSTDGGLFVGTGAPAKIYRIGKDGKAELYYTADAGYIWGLAEGAGGTLLAVTGEPGTVVQIDNKGSGKVIFAPEQTHLRSLVYDRELGIFVGGGERGIIYRSQNGKGFRALYDTGHTEVTSIVVHDGLVYAAGVTGAEELANEPVKADGKSGGGGGGGGAGKPSGGGPSVKSQLVRVGLDGSAETLAGSNDEAIFALAVDDKGQVLVATGATGRNDPRGRIYSIEPQRRLISMLLQSPSRRITHLVSLGRGALAAVAGAGGRITHLTSGYVDAGVFYTLPFDAGINSRFGILQLFGEAPAGTRIEGSVRTGQTSEPDDSWSDWSKPIALPGNDRPQVPNGRYVQIRITLKGDGKATPTLHRVRLAYLRQNLPPFVREVTALNKGLALYSIPQDQPKTKTINLADKPSSEDVRPGPGEEEERPAAFARARQVEETGALTLRWVAEDPNGDDLRYDLKYRPSGQGDWRVLKNELEAPFYTLKSSQLPDGHYQFRVEASDAPSNPDGEERNDSRDSRDVLVDNTPPQIDPLQVQVTGRRVLVRTVVADAVGPLTSASYSLDAKDLKPLLPEDGVLDGPGESFALRLGELAPGAHTFTLRVRDEAGNEGVAEASFVVR